MSRALVCCTVMAILAVPCRAGEPAPNPETLIRLDVRPAPAPEPALRYLLLPELEEMEPGNPIYNYLKCCMEQQAFLFDKEAFRRREELLAMPINELPAQDLQEYGRSALSQADWAARLDNPDWQILLKLKEDGFYTLLPDVQQMRGAGAGPPGPLPGRGRAGPIRRRHPDRQDDVRHVAPPGRASDAHRQPGGHRHREHRHRPAGGDAPAAGLPQPVLGADELARSLHLAEDGHGWRAGDRPGRVPRPGRQGPDETRPSVQAFIAHMDMVLGERGAASSRPRACGAGWTPGSRTRRRSPRPAVASSSTACPKSGWRAFPADQVILLDEKLEYEIRRDDVMKTMTLPFCAGRGARREPRRNGRRHLFADALVPATKAVRRARADLEQRIALLRHVEALRTVRRRARRQAARQPLRGLGAAPRRPVQRQAVPLRADRGHGASPRQSAVGRGEGPRLQHPLRADHPEVSQASRAGAGSVDRVRGRGS